MNRRVLGAVLRWCSGRTSTPPEPVRLPDPVDTQAGHAFEVLNNFWTAGPERQVATGRWERWC